MNRRVLVVLSLAFALLSSGCSQERAELPSPPTPVESQSVTSTVESRTATSSVSAQLLPLDSSNEGRLQGVGVVSGSAMGFAPGAPAARASEKYGNFVEVRVPDSIRGVETHMTVPMWYGDHTKYRVEYEKQWSTLAAAVKDGSVIWWAARGADITYHFEDGYFVLDSMKVKTAH